MALSVQMESPTPAIRENPAVARSYGALKKRLAAECANDIDYYIAAKTEFILGVLRRSGFPLDELQWISHANRAP